MKRWIIMCVMMCFFACQNVQAADTTKKVQDAFEDQFLKETELHKIDEILEEIFPEDLSFRELIELLLNEEKTISAEKIFDFVSEHLFNAVRKNKTAIVCLFVISLVSAFFSNFIRVFQTRQISSIGFYIVYLLMISICLRAFQLTVTEIETSMEQLVTFMKFFSPIYFVSMAVSVGSVSSIAFYNIVIFLIYIVVLLL